MPESLAEFSTCHRSTSWGLFFKSLRQVRIGLPWLSISPPISSMLSTTSPFLNPLPTTYAFGWRKRRSIHQCCHSLAYPGAGGVPELFLSYSTWGCIERLCRELSSDGSIGRWVFPSCLVPQVFPTSLGVGLGRWNPLATTVPSWTQLSMQLLPTALAGVGQKWARTEVALGGSCLPVPRGTSREGKVENRSGSGAGYKEEDWGCWEWGERAYYPFVDLKKKSPALVPITWFACLCWEGEGEGKRVQPPLQNQSLLLHPLLQNCGSSCGDNMLHPGGSKLQKLWTLPSIFKEGLNKRKLKYMLPACTNGLVGRRIWKLGNAWSIFDCNWKAIENLFRIFFIFTFTKYFVI